MPRDFRNLPNVDSYPDVVKKKLDRFLSVVPDEPRLPGYLPTNSAASNLMEDPVRVMACRNEDYHLLELPYYY